MFDPEALLHEVAADLNRAAKISKVREIAVSCEDLLTATEKFVPHLNSDPKDNFYGYMKTVRRNATTLHEDCVKFIRSESLKDIDNFRLQASKRWAELYDLMILAIKMKSRSDAELVCAAL